MDDLAYYTGFVESLILWLKAHTANIIIIFVGAWVLILLSAFLIRSACNLVKTQYRGSQDEIAEHSKRAKTLFSLLRRIINAVVIASAVIMILAEIGVNITALLAGAGMLGVALGFGAQNVVKDMLAGLFMLFEDQYRVGDYIEVNGGQLGGIVEKLTLRTTWLRSIEGTVHIIPNGTITAISNHTHTWSRTVLDIGISYGDDIDSAIQVIQAAADSLFAESPWDAMVLDKPEVLGVEELGDSAVKIRLSVKTMPMNQWLVARELRRRIKYSVEAAGMSIPFPQLTVNYAGYHLEKE